MHNSSYYKNDERIFWYAVRGQETVAIDLQHEEYDRLILGTGDVNQLINKLNHHKKKRKNPS